MISRRQFFKLAAAAGLSVAVPRQWAASRVMASASVPQTPIAGKTIPKYVEPLPVFGSPLGLEKGQVNAPRVSASGGPVTVSMHEVQQKVLPAGFYKNLPAQYNAGTYVWAYNVGGSLPLYPGITVEAQRGVPATIKYVNMLPVSPILQELTTTDQTLHWANPLGLEMMDMARQDPYLGPPPVVTHLHGAEVQSFYDGGPDEWFTPDGIHGGGYSTAAPTDANAAIYEYINEQEASTLWFHDHTLGATRLNVYRGLAAFYLLRDEYDTGLPNNPLRLPAGPYEREIAIQDRMFDVNGQWFFPEGDEDGFNGTAPNPLIHPYWNPEFFGDVMVVNGKSWPYLRVEPRRYRFRLLDGCNARFLELRLLNRDTKKDGPPFWIIGNDGGLLDTPAMLNEPNVPKPRRLLMAPGERYDVIIDFSGYAGQTLTLLNGAKAPYPSGTSPDPQTNGQVMQFRVDLPLQGTDASFNPAAAGARLRGKTGQAPAILRLADPATAAPVVKPDVVRQLVLLEVEGAGGPVEVLVNNTRWIGRRDDDEETPIPDTDEDDLGNFLTELPRVGATEVWEIVNLTMDAHPMHFHLVQAQLISRQMFNMTQYKDLYASCFPGGKFGGVTDTDEWAQVEYAPGVIIPAYGPPLLYDGSDPRSGGKLGGNPDVTPFLQGMAMPPGPEEVGWKDTFKMWPGMVSRVVMRFAPQDTPLGATAPGINCYGFDPTQGPGYVWHCHIVDHEDNEMMRPYKVMP